ASCFGRYHSHYKTDLVPEEDVKKLRTTIRYKMMSVLSAYRSILYTQNIFYSDCCPVET
ncbi:CBWD1 isoform 24, partial [Pan troglodytes]